MTSIGSRIKKRMKEKGFNQKKLAELAGISQKGLSELIHDKFEPRLSTLRLLSKYLDMPLTEIVFGETPLDYAARRFTKEQMLKVEDQKSHYLSKNQKGLEDLVEKVFKLDSANRTLVEQLVDQLLTAQRSRE
ncbi:MAG: helix-turn-helix domain-containing protein [bacterium]